MPAKTLTVRAKNKEDLRKNVDKVLKDASRKGMIFVKQGYKESRIKKSRGEYEIDITCPEFTCVCPKTGQPDFASINIKYVPDRLCIELKSLKLYMFSYRGIGTFHEHVTNKILDDVVEACNPVRAEVTGDFNVRGGIKTVVRASYHKSESGKAGFKR